jgi:hypothetical protein
LRVKKKGGKNILVHTIIQDKKPTMTLKDFNQNYQGKINLTLLPNGVTHDKNGQLAYSFSLITGIHRDPPAGAPPGTGEDDFIAINRPDELIRDIIAAVRKISSQLMWWRDSESPILLFDPKQPPQLFNVNYEEMKLWDHLMGRPEHNFKGRSSQKISVGNAHPMHDDELLHFTGAPYDPMNSLPGGQTTIEQIRKATKLHSRHSQKYNQIKTRGRNHSGHLHHHQKSFPKDKSVMNVDVLHVLHSIFLHPSMAREYGLIYDFTVPVNAVTGTPTTPGLPANYVNADHSLRNFSLTLGVASNYSDLNYFGTLILNPAPPDSALSQLNAGTRLFPNGKYFHGSKQYGLTRNYFLNKTDTPSFQYIFSTMSPDHKLQNQQLGYQTQDQANKAGRRTRSYSDYKQPVTQGIYLLQIGGDANGSTPIGQDHNKIGVNDQNILGQNIAVSVDDTTDPNSYFSLCRRRALYRLRMRGKEENTVTEEGWIHNNVLLNGQSTQYQIQQIFQWTGHNLCIQKPKSDHKDQQGYKTPADYGKGGIEGHFSNEEGAYLDKYGFECTYSLAPGQEIFLANRHRYSFLIRDVLLNGYVLPLHFTDTETNAATIQDLLADPDLSDKWFPFVEQAPPDPASPQSYSVAGKPFSLDRDPVLPPVLRADKKFIPDPAEDTDTPITTPGSTESVTHILFPRNGKENVRYLYPPMIDFQFACLLGLLTPENLAAGRSERKFLDYAWELLSRSTRRFEDGKINPMNYLSDTRGRTIQFLPGNWYTKNFFVEAFTIADAYPYPAVGDPYVGIAPWKLTVRFSDEWSETGKPGARFFQEFPDRTLVLEIRRGLELSFSYRFFGTTGVFPHHVLALAKNEVEAMIGRQLPDASVDHPIYPKSSFQISYLPPKAGTEFYLAGQADSTGNLPLLASRYVPDTSQPEKEESAAQAFSFYTFKVVGLQYSALQRLELLTNYVNMKDDGLHQPPLTQMNAIRDQWLDQNGHGKLLEFEYPVTVFDRPVANSHETQVYKQNTGVRFLLPTSLVTHLQPGDIIWTFHFSPDADLVLKYPDQTGQPQTIVTLEICLLDPKLSNKVPVTLTFLLDSVHEVRLNYIYDNAEPQLVFNLMVDGHYNPVSTTCLPYPNLNWKRLVLSPDIEPHLLAVGLDPEQGSLRYFHDAHFSFIDSDIYFAYHKETDLQFVQKQVQVKAFSAYPSIYPTAKPAEYILTSPAIRVNIPSNERPTKPVISLVPLLAKDIIQDNIAALPSGELTPRQRRQRTMQVLFEIDRPLKAEEKLGLVIGQVDVNGKVNLTSSTCAIGRDLTTFGAEFNDPTKTIGLPLQQFILRDQLDYPYLEKYLWRNGERERVVLPDGITSVELLILTPFFDERRGKYIVVLGFNDFRIKGLPAYNPFIKIVAVKYNTGGNTGIEVSLPTEPKYLNLLSPRRVNFTAITSEVTVIRTGQPQESRRDEIWHIQVENSDAHKEAPGAIDTVSRTIFVAVVREPERNGILGDATPSTPIKFANSTYTVDDSVSGIYQVMDSSNELYLRKQGGKVLCLYEFETFNNSGPLPGDTIDWLNVPGLRLIYAEEFS